MPSTTEQRSPKGRSTTRSTLQTGRNHHLNGYASIAETSNGFPGYSGRFPGEPYVNLEAEAKRMMMQH